jgi:hypothetical protein
MYYALGSILVTPTVVFMHQETFLISVLDCITTQFANAYGRAVMPTSWSCCASGTEGACDKAYHDKSTLVLLFTVNMMERLDLREATCMKQ